MNRTRVLAIATVILLAFGVRSGHGADSTPQGPSARSGRRPAEPRLTPDDVRRMREDSWKKPAIPASDVIESIVTEAYGHPLSIEDVRPFVIPKKYHDQLLKRFREAELDESPWQDDELGTIRIRLVGGRSLRICWFLAGQGNRLHFSFCGTRFVATGERFAKDETLKMDAFVRRINRIEVFHKDGETLPLWLPSHK